MQRRLPRDLPRPALCAIALACVVAAGAAAADGISTARSFAARSGPRGATLFHRMPPEETGLVVENNYDDPRMWGERSRGFFYGPLGTGVAIGDYDADGRPDILAVSKVEGHRLFRNLGGWRFEDVTQVSGVASPPDGEWEQGACWTDIDNDGALDLYICRSGAANLLYINQRDGTFREEAAARGLDVVDDSVMAAFCDYDRDGWLDLYLVTNTLDVNQDAGRPDRLFHNNGDGTFTDVTAVAGIGSYPFQGHAATWWDYDNDGWPDLYVCNDFSPPDILYHNERDGTFSMNANRAVPHTPDSSMGADLGDLNNDGLIDLLVADMEPTTHEKEHRTMAEARAKLNDPFIDPLTSIQLPRNALYLNTGTEHCLEAAELAGIAATDWTWSVRCEDLDQDGRLDLFFTNGMNREQNNLDLSRRISRASSLREQIQIMRSSPVLSEANIAYRNLGDLRFEDVGEAWGLNEKGVSFGAALGDLDDDGDLDLVYTNYRAGLSVLRNDADTGHRITISLRGTRSNRLGVGTLVRLETASGVQVRQLVLARGYMSTSEPVLHFGLGQDDRVNRVTLHWPSGHVQVLQNLGVDLAYTVTEPSEAPPSPSSTPMSPRPQFVEVGEYAGVAKLQREDRLDESRIQPLLPRSFNRCGPALAVGDLNGDRLDDICLGGTTQDPLRVLIADGKGDFQETPLVPSSSRAGANDGPILIFDVDGDDHNDLLITAGGIGAPVESAAYKPRLLLHRGAGRFESAPDAFFPDLRGPIGAAVAGDINRDGRLDLFLGGRLAPGRYPEAPKSLLLLNRGDHFEDVTASWAPELRHVGLVTSALWSDVDGDGWLDLLVALEWGPVRFFHNADGRRLEDRSADAGFLAAGTGLWSSLAAADFNGDGQPDYVAGNLGLNTPYRASAQHPILLLRGPFGDNSTPLTLEGYFEHDKLLPRASRGELGAVLPSILRKFPRYDDYARATLADLFGADQIGTASRFGATQLQSGVFLSQADGTFRFDPLPRIAQVAPLQGLLTGDLDGDGHADIFATQNCGSFSQAVGRFDGGLGQFLRGNGKGGFEPVPARVSGLILPGDARSTATIDLDADGWPDALVSRSRSSTLGWQNRGAPGRRPLEIRLQGRRGNREAVGARVAVELADGTLQTSDVMAGGGVSSQSTTGLHFGFPEDNPPHRIFVRWPDGQVTAADVSSTGNRIRLAWPGP